MTGIPLTTEAQWLACTDPRWMMTCALIASRHQKIRLFAAACCRRVWRFLSDLCFALIGAYREPCEKPFRSLSRSSGI